MKNTLVKFTQDNDQNILLVVPKDDLIQFANTIVRETVNEIDVLLDKKNKPDELLTREQVREYLGTSYPTLHRLKKKGRLIPIKKEGSVRYLRSDVDAYINNKK